MKKFVLFFIPLILTVMSCSDDAEIIRPSELPAYTVMIYAQGGELDSLLFETVKDLYNYGSTEKVNVTMQIKMSKKYQEKEGSQLIKDHRGIVRYVLPEAGQKVGLEKIGNVEDPFSTPEKLKEFILWSKEKCPARNYILVMWGHGTGWSYGSDCPKACLPDDNREDEFITNVGLARAIRESGVHIKVLDFYCCSMARMETIFEFGETVDYARISNEPITGNGHETADLVKLIDESLNKSDPSDELVESVWTAYLGKLTECWEKAMPRVQVSAAFTDLRKLQPLMAATKEFKELLISSYAANKEGIDAATCACYRCLGDSDEPQDDHEYDIVDYALQVSMKLQATNPELSAKFAGIHEKLRNAVTNAEVFRTENEDKKKVFANKLSYGILLTNKSGYETWQQKGYTLLSFEAVSGWSQWLKTNEQMPVGNPCPFAVLMREPFIGNWESDLGDGWLSRVSFSESQDYSEFEYERANPDNKRKEFTARWFEVSGSKGRINLEYEEGGEKRNRDILVTVNDERTELTLKDLSGAQESRIYKKLSN